MPKCTICSHRDRVEIERLILQGESERAIAKRFNVSHSAVGRHKKNHLAAQMAKATAESLRTAEELLREIRIRNNQFEAYKQILEKLLEAVQEAIAEPIQEVEDAKGRKRLIFPGKMIIDTIAELRKLLAGQERYLELEARVLKLIEEDEITLDIFKLPEWFEIRERLFQCLKPFPEARRAVVEAFSSEDLTD